MDFTIYIQKETYDDKVKIRNWINGFDPSCEHDKNIMEQVNPIVLHHLEQLKEEINQLNLQQ